MHRWAYVLHCTTSCPAFSPYPPPPAPAPAPSRPAVFIAICARLGLIRSSDWATYDADDVAAGLQNFLICIEMFMAAVAHAHAFPPRVSTSSSGSSNGRGRGTGGGGCWLQAGKRAKGMTHLLP